MIRKLYNCNQVICYIENSSLRNTDKHFSKAVQDAFNFWINSFHSELELKSKLPLERSQPCQGWITTGSPPWPFLFSPQMCLWGLQGSDEKIVSRAHQKVLQSANASSFWCRQSSSCYPRPAGWCFITFRLQISSQAITCVVQQWEPFIYVFICIKTEIAMQNILLIIPIKIM